MASTDGRGALSGGPAASNAANGAGANGSFQANGAAGNALNASSGTARGIQGSAQNTAGAGAPTQAGGVGTPNASAAFGAKLAAQRAQDDNAASTSSTFNATKKSDDTASDAAMTNASADLSDKATSTDTSALTGTNNAAIDPNLLAGSATHTADNGLMAAAQAQSNQAPAASQNAYASGNIDMPFADARWADAFSQRVVMMPRGGQTQASLHLNPPNLGPVQVVLNMVGNQAQASFVSQHAHVRDAIAAALPSLKDRFAESGMSLTQTSVTDTIPTNAANAANPNFNASLTAGLNTSADASTGGRGQNNNAAPDPFAISGVRRAPASAVASSAAANAWRPAGAPIDNGNARLGIDTFA
jgi:flagellar hook-length control protein FliK